jgi:hypothetical protein
MGLERRRRVGRGSPVWQGVSFGDHDACVVTYDIEPSLFGKKIPWLRLLLPSSLPGQRGR